jgi:cell division protease FtsH
MRHAVGPNADRSRALLAALDGVASSSTGPFTIALSLIPALHLSSPAIRPGRLSPHLELDPPELDDRRALFANSIAERPVNGPIDLDRLAERTIGWTGAEIVGAVEEAVSRSLPDHTDSVRMDLLLDVLTERFAITDEKPSDDVVHRLTAQHEAGHAVHGHLLWPGRVTVMRVTPDGGMTEFDETLIEGFQSIERLRQLAAVMLAGCAAEELFAGRTGVTDGTISDRAIATRHIESMLMAELRYAPQTIEGPSGRGSERMRASLHVAIEQAANAIYAEALAFLSPHKAALDRLATAVLEADDHTLSGSALASAIDAALTPA